MISAVLNDQAGSGIAEDLVIPGGKHLRGLDHLGVDFQYVHLFHRIKEHFTGSHAAGQSQNHYLFWVGVKQQGNVGKKALGKPVSVG